jgi:hypothetical protein
MSIVAKFFAVHTYRQDPAATWAFLGQGAPELAVQMATGQTPAKCVYTWNPLTHGRADYMFCVWEAEKAEDVQAVLASSGIDAYINTDLMPVDEIDWAAMAQTARQAAVA